VIGGVLGAAGGVLVAKNNNVDPAVGLIGGLAAGWAVGSQIGDHIAFRRAGFRSRAEYLAACRQSAIRADERALAVRNNVRNQLPQVNADLAQAKRINDQKTIYNKQRDLKQMQSQLRSEQGKLMKEVEAQKHALKTESSNKDAEWQALQQRLKRLETRQNELAAEDQRLEGNLTQVNH
jgi:septal ring factor EnvC (AmiA/AmiB activator)